MRKNGFTLIEVLASIVLITVALIPIMRIIPQMIENSLKAERLTTAIFLAQGKTDEVKNALINSFSTSQDAAVTAFASPYTSYKYIVTDDDSTGIKDIQVEVWYDEDDDDSRDATEESITINTKVADRG
ncbi:MAG: type II secretion system protein [Candidatus Omnitrophota bacterium]